MDYILPFLLGIIVAAPGIMLPGLLNITAAKISLTGGRNRAMIFAIGATCVIFVQAYLAVTFAKFINSRQDIIDLLQEIGLGIFLVLTIYFLFIAKAPKQGDDEKAGKLRSRAGEFFFGIMLSALNFFPIPFYVFASISLSRSNYFFFDSLFVFLFVMGAVTGSFGVFYLYIISFRKFEHKATFFLKNINYFIGGITAIVCVITIIKLLR